MGWYKKQLKQRGEKIQQKKRKKRIEEFTSKSFTRNEFDSQLYPRNIILQLLLTQGAIPKEVFRLSPDKRKFQTASQIMQKMGMLKETHTPNGIVVTFDNFDKYETNLRDAFGELAVSYYIENRIKEMGDITRRVTGKRTNKTLQYLTSQKRDYRLAYVRALMSYADVSSFITNRGILHIKRTFAGQKPFYLSPNDIRNEIETNEGYEELRSKIANVRNAFYSSRNHGVVMSEGGNYIVYDIQRELMKWTSGIEKTFARQLGEFNKKCFNDNSPFFPLVLCNDTETIKRLIENDAKERIMKNLMHVDGSINKTMYVTTLTPEGISHLKEMTKKDWINASNKRCGLTFEELKRKDESSISCTAVRIVGDRQEFILNYCIPNLVDLKRFTIACNSNKDEGKSFTVYCYPYQRGLIEYLMWNNCEIREIVQTEQMRNNV